MSTTLSGGKIAAVIALIVVLFAGMFTMGAFGFFNTSTTMITAYEAKVDANRADFDNVWKQISQVAQVPDKYREDFQGVYETYMKSRQGGNTGDGELLSFLSEAVPQYDAQSLYLKVQTVIEARREAWTMRQKELRDLKREHDTLLRTFPGLVYNIFVGHDELVAVVITSDKTEEVFRDGRDNDVQVF
jgi:ABC-type Na+ efflux pump permease subunit